MADAETLSTPAPASASASASTKKKKKHSKNHKATDEAPTNVTVDAPTDEAPTNVTVDAPTDEAPTNVTFDAPTDEAPTNVTVDASLTGGSSYAAAAPVVGYFPSGYDPLAAPPAAAGAESSPRTRLFRHEKHPTWVDLVVRSPGGGPDFVGQSYAGEAAAPQLCEYALGVLDKASGTLRVVPIAAKKILRLEPHLEVQRPAHSQHSEVASEAASAAGNDELKVQDLTMMYGTKMDRDKDNKWRSLNEQRNDPSAFEDIDLGGSETAANTIDSQEPVLIRNIPPYDPTADTSEKAYLLDEIIPKSMRQHLLQIIDHFESGEFSSKGYGGFVSKRVHKLNELQFPSRGMDATWEKSFWKGKEGTWAQELATNEGEDKERFAWILSYIQHLLSLLARNGSMSKRQRKERNENQTNRGPATPQAVYRRLLLMFTEPGSSVMSTEKNELLINYILVLTLFADDFRSNPNDICEDLKMTRQKLKPYYDQLGCKSVSEGAFKGSVMTLPAPLKFPKDVTRKRRRQ